MRSDRDHRTTCRQKFSACQGTLGRVPPKGCESNNVSELGTAADDPVHEAGGNVKTVQSRDCNAGFTKTAGCLLERTLNAQNAACAGGALNEHGGTDTPKTFGSVWFHGHETPMYRFGGVLLRRLGRVEQVALLAVMGLSARGMVRRWRLCHVEALVLWVLLAIADDLGIDTLVMLEHNVRWTRLLE